jgi:hypothetical protein
MALATVGNIPRSPEARRSVHLGRFATRGTTVSSPGGCLLGTVDLGEQGYGDPILQVFEFGDRQMHGAALPGVPHDGIEGAAPCLDAMNNADSLSLCQIAQLGLYVRREVDREALHVPNLAALEAS